MTSVLPTWTEIDPGAPLTFADGVPSGRVVALVAGPGAVEAGWSADAVLQIADGWGRRVVVADAGLESPSLAEVAGVASEEGLSDLLLWGASVKRVTRRRDTGGLVVTSGTPVADAAAAFAEARWRTLCDGFRQAGVTFAVLVPSTDPSVSSVVEIADDVVIMAAPDEDALALLAFGHEKVRAVVGREGGVEPADEAEAPAEPALEVVEGDEAGVEEVAAEVSELVDETPTEEDSEDGALEFEEAPVWEPAALAPEEEDEAEPVTAFGAFPLDGDELDEEEGQDEESAETAMTFDAPSDDPLAPDADFRFDAPEGDEDPVPPSAMEEPAADEDGWSDPLLDGPTAAAEPTDAPEDPLDAVPPMPTFEEVVMEAEMEQTRGGGRRTVLLVVLLVLIVATAAAAYLGFVNIPGITPAASEGVEAPTQAPTPPVAAAPARETSVVMAFSVALGAYQDSAVANQTVASFAAKVPDVLFVIAPVEVNGSVYERVLAGPAQDSAAAIALAAHVSEVTGANPSTWVTRSSPQAFQLGEMADLEAARRRETALRDLGIPAYTLAVDYDDGSVRYRVYAGAYADDSEAAYLSGLLQERGLSTATLSDRIGRLPE